MRSKKIKSMTLFAMFLAIEMVLVFTPLGFINLGFLAITLMHIPVIIAAVTMGKKAGMCMGLVFGICSVVNATFQPNLTSFCFTPFIEIGGVHGNWGSLIIAIVPRIAIGYVSAVVYEFFSKKMKNKSMPFFLAGIAGALTNTVLVLSLIYIIFGPAYAQAIGISYDVLIISLLTVVATNGIFEAVFGAFLTMMVGRALKASI